MFMFPDGRPYVLTFNQVEQRYYAAFVDEFPEADVSISQWRGGYEYQTLYPAIQMMVENGIMTLDALNEILGVIADTNQSIYRPAVLQSRVAERFAQAGYEATARIADATTRGIVAICVDQERTPFDYDSTLIPASGDPSGNTGEMGWRTGTYGANSNTSLLHSEITMITTTATPDRINVRFGQAIGPDPFTMEIGGIPVSFTTSDGGINFIGIDSAAYSLIWNGEGDQIHLFVAGGGTFEAVNDDDAVIGNLIRDELLPAGQHIEGNVVYETALSNGQPLAIRWTVPIEDPRTFRTTITRARGSQYPMDSVDQIILKFNANFAALMGIGRDITPQRYLTPHDLPWASSVFTEWFDGSVWQSSDKPANYTSKFLATLPPANVVIV